jgi:hypothetical protein
MVRVGDWSLTRRADGGWSFWMQVSPSPYGYIARGLRARTRRDAVAEAAAVAAGQSFELGRTTTARRAGCSLELTGRAVVQRGTACDTTTHEKTTP